MSRIVFINGNYVEEKDAKISIFDSAVMLRYFVYFKPLD